MEKTFKLHITDFDLPFIGVIDLVAEVEGKNTIADFKTAASAYDGHMSDLSDQLTSYQLTEPDAEQVALWVLVKTKEPRIELYPSKRGPDRLREFLSKVGYLAREIQAEHFYKRPGMLCAWCDYLPVCLGDKETTKETLVQVK